MLKFKVFEVCEQCNQIIEEAAQGKGVISANWDMYSKIFTLIFNPEQTAHSPV